MRIKPCIYSNLTDFTNVLNYFEHAWQLASPLYLIYLSDEKDYFKCT